MSRRCVLPIHTSLPLTSSTVAHGLLMCFLVSTISFSVSLLLTVWSKVTLPLLAGNALLDIMLNWLECSTRIDTYKMAIGDLA
jgi:hypothetical protein